MNVRIWLGAGGALLVAGLVATTLGPAPAHAESSFSALSSATAVDVTVANGDIPVVTVVEAAGPSAGTSLDSTGQGTAFASDPYPGTTVAELPATAAGLSGLPVPAYPLFVATTSDDQPADYSKPGIELHARCAATGHRAARVRRWRVPDRRRHRRTRRCSSRLPTASWPRHGQRSRASAFLATSRCQAHARRRR